MCTFISFGFFVSVFVFVHASDYFSIIIQNDLVHVQIFLKIKLELIICEGSENFCPHVNFCRKLRLLSTRSSGFSRLSRTVYVRLN